MKNVPIIPHRKKEEPIYITYEFAVLRECEPKTKKTGGGRRVEWLKQKTKQKQVRTDLQNLAHHHTRTIGWEAKNTKQGHGTNQ